MIQLKLKIHMINDTRNIMNLNLKTQIEKKGNLLVNPTNVLVERRKHCSRIHGIATCT